MQVLNKTIKSKADLAAVKEGYFKRLEGKAFRIQVCSGAGCISSDCHSVRDALLECLEANGLSDSVEVIETGCIGTCDIGPVVVVTSLKQKDAAQKAVFYIKLTPQDISEIVESHLVQNKVLVEKTYFDRKQNKHIPFMEDIEYFNNQTKIALRNCGSIDHGSLEQYIAYDGYMAAAKSVRRQHAGNGSRRSQKVRAQGQRRRRLPDRYQAGSRNESPGRGQIPGMQCR